MTEYLLRFRFAHVDDDHAQRLAVSMAGMFVAEWDGNGVTWEGVERAVGSPLELAPAPAVDPVLVSAAWGGRARPVESDEDMEGVVSRVLAALGRQEAVREEQGR